MSTEKGANNFWKEAWEWTYTILIAIVIAFLIKAFLFDIVKVDGLSMYPTLQHADRLIVSKLGYEPKHGDIVILDANYKKRQEFYEDDAKAKGKDKLNALEKGAEYFSIPKNLRRKYYVKRVIALPGQTVDIKDGKVLVDGKVLDEYYYKGKTSPTDPAISYPVTVEDDTVFVMGDNRNNSTDSRASSLGLVPYNAVIGKAQFRFFPFNSIGSVYSK